jgi:serine/threonine protein kinase/formylglycine-generating enzyme required for sulfatase activity
LLRKLIAKLNDSNPIDVTQDNKGNAIPQDDAEPAEHPQRIGRYRIEKVLGKGGFGLVYLAHDQQLDRLVAIKVPHAKLITQPEDAEAYLAEARTVANLDHPHIVPVFDVGSTEECPCFVVSKYIEGTDLSKKLKESRLKYRDAAELVATAAEALHYAHMQGLVHRDVKPGNILIGKDGQPYVVDFGLALREENVGKGPKYAGTPAYMSPEQARGEGHRVDGRSDIFSLGVVFYELLVGRQPFRGDTQAELLEQVTSYEPRPPRQYDDRIPKEVERICHKAIAKRASERYSTAKDFAEDLRLFLAEQTVIQSGTSPGGVSSLASEAVASQGGSTAVDSSATSSASMNLGSSDSQPIKIVPKGLRCFDAHDADFFLELLPGPRDRDGLPDSLRFWKTRIEEPDPDNTFSVGLIYGPSGCGKSSLVKAGLLPRLSEEVIPVYIEATPEETETRLLHGLRKRCPALEDNLNLKDTLAALRRGQGIPVGKKVLIVLDQFEQWLHAKKEEENTDLVQALRQCDGGRVQCIVMVRDDFWMAVSRFLRELEVRLLEGHNIALADLFDVHHARKVLAAFGRAFGKLPEKISETTDEQKDFLKQSVVGLAEEGKVVCVRLALFAEMMKGKTWTPATLKEVGGTAGVGVTFLEETFSSSAASPEHRYHQKAARAVLNDLLPDSGTDLKGYMRSHAELLEASGYGNRPKDFDDLVRILDSEIRLITPTDPEGKEPNNETVTHTEAGQKYFQLTHDYLVHSLREWLTRKQKETRRGRAEIRLFDRSVTWNAKPENRHLPSWLENVNVRLFTDKRKWTQPQRKMMGKAARVHGLRTGVVALLLVAMTFAGVRIRNAVLEQQARTQAQFQEKENTTRADSLVESLLSAEITQVPAVVSDLTELRQWADPLLKTKIGDAQDSSAEKLHLALALLPVDDSQIDYLNGQLVVCTLDQFPVVREALLPHKDKITDALWQLVQDDQQDAALRFQAAAALSEYAPDDDRWYKVAPFVAQHLTSAVSSVSFGLWLKHFRPVSQQLTGPLTGIHAARSRSEKQRETAALSLADYLQDKPDELTDVILLADELAEFSPLINAMQPHSPSVTKRLISMMRAPMPNELVVEERDAHWKRQSLAAVTLVHLGYGDEVWSRLEFSPDPSLRSFIIHHLGILGTDHNTLVARLKLEEDVTIRRGLIQSLGGLDATRIPTADRSRIAQQLRALFVNDPDPGIHGSVSWTLRQLGEPLPELPVGEPTLTEEQIQRIAVLTAQIESIRQRIADSEQELPVRQAAWERKLRERAQVEPASLKDGLVGHYPLDESEGTETANAVEGQLGGTYQGPGKPEWVPGILRGALRLNGKGGYINCGDAFNPERTDAFSYGCWFFAANNRQRAALLAKVHIGPDKSHRGIDMEIVDGRIGAAAFHSWPEYWMSVSTTPVLENHWHFVIATYDGSSTASGVTIYVDGQSVPTTVPSDTLKDTRETIQNSVPLRIGNREGSVYLSPFQGQIDDVRVYNRCLTGEEVQQLYQFGLESLVGLPAEKRTPEQQSSLARAYRAQDEPLKRLESELAAAMIPLRDFRNGIRRWHVINEGQTFVVIPNPTEYGDNAIDHSFAISSHEVTAEQFVRFKEDHGAVFNGTPSDDYPANSISWYRAAEYCNWLSDQEGIPKEQWVYLPNAKGDYSEGMQIRENYLQLMGYRLPTEEEWEYACRSGTTEANYYFGEPLPLLERYAWYGQNSEGHSHPVGTLLPNDTGLFDMHGNVGELTQLKVENSPSQVRSRNSVVMRGGSYSHSSSSVRPESRRTGDGPAFRNEFHGFRPCRTVRRQSK